MQGQIQSFEYGDKIASNFDRAEHIGFPEIQLRITDAAEEGLSIAEDDAPDRRVVARSGLKAIPKQQANWRGPNRRPNLAQRPAIERIRERGNPLTGERLMLAGDVCSHAIQPFDRRRTSSRVSRVQSRIFNTNVPRNFKRHVKGKPASVNSLSDVRRIVPVSRNGHASRSHAENMSDSAASPTEMLFGNSTRTESWRREWESVPPTTSEACRCQPEDHSSRRRASVSKRMMACHP